MKIDNLENIIIDVLERNKFTRKDDHMLYIEVCSDINPNCLDNFMEAFKYRKEFELPSFESVSRCRRKVQERYPDLKEYNVAEKRYDKQVDYIDYAINNKNIEI